MLNDRVLPPNGAQILAEAPAAGSLPSRSELFRQAGRKLRQDFQQRQAGHPEDAAGALREFLVAHLPRRFGLGFGHVIDAAEQTSAFCPVVIYDALNCPTYSAGAGAVFPAETVAAVIEVRSTLEGTELRAAIERIAHVKSLRWRDASAGALRPVLGAVFAPAASIPFDGLIQEYTRSLRERDLAVQPDLIGVGDQGIMLPHASRYGTTNWYPLFATDLHPMRSEGMHLAAGGLELGEYTLDGFFRFLLAHLLWVRPAAPYAGFDWLKTEVNLELLLQYVGSHTDETDALRRAEVLERYRADAMKSLGL
jgi:hypothetical protein